MINDPDFIDGVILALLALVALALIWYFLGGYETF